VYKMLSNLGDIVGLSPDPSIRNGVALVLSIFIYAVFLLRDKS